MAEKVGRQKMGLLKILTIFAFISCCYADMEIGVDTFKVYRFPKQITTQKNHIKLRFKTIHSTGLIMFAQGANKKDFLSVELFRGKIRLAGDYGRGTENKLRPIGGFYDMYLGKDLADNEWHTVEVVRNIRESIIFIDRGRGKMEKSIFMKSPPTYNELSVSMVTFGGYYSFSTSEISTNQALSRKGLSGCFSEATFSTTWPEDDTQEIDFLKSGVGQIVGESNDVKGVCSDMSSYKPMFFPSSAVHLALVEPYNQTGLQMSLKFRTVVSDSVIANYTHIRTGQRLQLKLDREGRVELGFDLGHRLQVIETAKEKYHDGEWHSASFVVNNVKNGESYEVEFVVDGKTRLSKMSDIFKFEGAVNVGFGFTGCMRDIKINNYELYRVPKKADNLNDVFRISDIGVVKNYCSLKDYCNPNPCQNGGKCNQTEDNIVCDCRGTLYEGSTCHRPRFNYTCAGVRKSGERRSDVYYIDFDGLGPMEPVQALCDLGKTVETTVTQINNTKIKDKNVLTDTGKNDFDVEYLASITQMRELIKNSATCSQFIKLQCKGVPIFLSPTGPPAANWIGGDDVVHYYWGGAKGQRGYCACGVRGDCKVGGRPTGQYCNCDSFQSKYQIVDEGNFTIKDHLPVRRVHFDKVLEGGGSEAMLRVGHLRCAGFGSRLNAATFRKPWSFVGMDHPDQPFDNIFAGSISFDFKTSIAYNYMTMMHAHGPFSGDYCKVMIWSRTMVRVLLNFGFGQIKQDVDISSTGRTLDDNDWHEFELMFNLKELNVTLDGIRMIQGLPLQDDPVQFNVDDKAVFVGGSYHDKNGFIGCIRSFYANGRIHDIRGAAEGLESSGVYPGCGSACVLLNRPCNYGKCEDQYNDFKCNCTVSPFTGKYCQNTTRGKQFNSGNSLEYTFAGNEPISQMIIVVGFKTTQNNAALAQLEGQDYRHVTLALVDGFLTLYYSFKKKVETSSGFDTDDEVKALRITKRRLNNDKHNVARVHFSHDAIYLQVPNYDLQVSDNITERIVVVDGGDVEQLDNFEVPTKLFIGRARDIKAGLSRTLPTAYEGCMSGAKAIYQPHATTTKRFRKSIELDFFKMMDEQKALDNGVQRNPTGDLPATECGTTLRTPGVLPPVDGPTQFFTKSPGLDNSVRVEPADLAQSIIICIVIIIIVVVILGFMYLTYKYINRSNKQYDRLKKQEKPRAVRMKQMPATSYQPAPTQPQSSYNPYGQGSGSGGGGQGEDNFYL
ncbi:EGF and laminin G domain-containing protein-like [Clytia hemisphaerica]|uniref:Uncharacterized protein n=1 Tax=Clytia hemisphaerica TaxID=252671 RepID=A0A7M5UZW5_9CNID